MVSFDSADGAAVAIPRVVSVKVPVEGTVEKVVDTTERIEVSLA